MERSDEVKVFNSSENIFLQLYCIVDQLLKTAFSISKVHCLEYDDRCPHERTHRLAAQSYVKMVVYEVDQLMANDSLWRDSPRLEDAIAQFVSEWEPVSCCLLRLAEDPMAVHSMCPAGVGCLVSKLKSATGGTVQRREEATLLQFERCRQSLSRRVQAIVAALPDSQFTCFEAIRARWQKFILPKLDKENPLLLFSERKSDGLAANKNSFEVIKYMVSLQQDVLSSNSVPDCLFPQLESERRENFSIYDDSIFENRRTVIQEEHAETIESISTVVTALALHISIVVTLGCLTWDVVVSGFSHSIPSLALLALQGLVLIPLFYNIPDSAHVIALGLSAAPVVGPKGMAFSPVLLAILATAATPFASRASLPCCLVWVGAALIRWLLLYPSEEKPLESYVFLAASVVPIVFLAHTMRMVQNTTLQRWCRLGTDGRFYRRAALNLLFTFDFRDSNEILVSRKRMTGEIQRAKEVIDRLRCVGLAADGELESVSDWNLLLDVIKQMETYFAPYDSRPESELTFSEASTVNPEMLNIQPHINQRTPTVDRALLRKIYDSARKGKEHPTRGDLAAEMRSDEEIRALWLLPQAILQGTPSLSTLEHNITMTLDLLDEDQDGTITWEEFEGELNKPGVEVKSKLRRSPGHRSPISPSPILIPIRSDNGSVISEMQGGLTPRSRSSCRTPRSPRSPCTPSSRPRTPISRSHLTRTESISSANGDTSNHGGSDPGMDLVFSKGMCPRIQSKLRCPVQHAVANHIGVVLIEIPLDALNSDITSRYFGSVVYWNSYMESTCGVAAEEVVGMPFTTLLLTDREQQNFARAVSSVMISGGIEPVTFSILRSDAEKVNYRVHVVPAFVDSSGTKILRLQARSNSASNPNLFGVVLLCTIQHSQKSNTKLSLAQWLVDQLRHPLVAVYDSVKKQKKVMQTNTVTQAEMNQYLDTLSNQTRRLVGLARQIRPLTAITLTQHPMALQATMSKIVTDYRLAACEKGISLHLEIDQDIPTAIYADAEKLPEAISYLLHNSIEHTGHGGHVWLIVQLLEEETDSEGVSSILFTIRDTGMGIKEEKLKTMFQPGRLWAGGKGSERSIVKPGAQPDWDLGLCNVKVVVEEMGGLLSVESRVNVGTSFSILLPLMPVEFGADDGEPEDDSSKAKSQSTWLVMETNKIYRTTICNYLWQKRYAVMISLSLQETLDNLKNVQVLLFGYEAVSSDQSLNTIMDQLVRKYPEIMVVLTVEQSLADRLPDEMTQAISSAGVHILVKPFRGTEVTATLNAIEEKMDDRERQKSEIEAVRKAFSDRSLPWKRGRLLGSGTHGKVYQAENEKTGGVMAVKVVEIQDDKQVRQILKEINFMSKLQHPHIIHYFYCEKSGGDIYLFMEYAKGGSLANVLQTNHPLPLNKVATYLEDILSGLAFLHSRDIVHRDLKPANVLITSDDKCKIADFGCAINWEKATWHTPDFASIGTPHYMAPEVLRGDKHDWRVDIWSLGCVVMEMMSGKLPFAHIGGWMQIWNYLNFEAGDNVDIGKMEEYRGNVDAYDFTRLCLRMDRTQRPLAEDLMAHRLITSYSTHFLWRQGSTGSSTNQQSLNASSTSPPLNLLNEEEATQSPKPTSLKGQPQRGHLVSGSPSSSEPPSPTINNADKPLGTDVTEPTPPPRPGMLVRNTSYATGLPPVPREHVTPNDASETTDESPRKKRRSRPHLTVDPLSQAADSPSLSPSLSPVRLTIVTSPQEELLVPQSPTLTEPRGDSPTPAFLSPDDDAPV